MPGVYWQPCHKPGNLTTMKTHRYFDNSVTARRPYLTLEMCRKVIENPHTTNVQEDGRTQYWGYVAEYDKWLRVIVMEDGETLFNAFFDRGFKP